MGSPHAEPRRTTVRLGSVAALVALLALLLAACSSPANEDAGPDGRPDAADWAVNWDETRDLVPHLDDLGVPPDQAVCERTVADLRTARETLFPTPDELVDTETEAWMEAATSLFFECFQSDIGAETVTEGYGELDRLGSEVDTALEGVS
ncbi:MAG TPA: hypothetical protein VJ978_11200 [Nitriliruptoraceae bacterium]|nr:hypothetical protein [Nitriliruptoraceae bacterium]